MKRILILVLCLLLVCCAAAVVGAVAEEVPASDFSLELAVTYHQTEARKVYDLLNAFRTGSDAWYWNEDDTEKVAAGNLQAMQYDASLERIAMQRAAELVVQTAHVRPDGTQCFSAFGSYRSAAENIAAGQISAEDVQKAWREDNEPYKGQGHRRVMLSDSLTAVGIACVEYNGRYYWAEAFKSTYEEETLQDPFDGEMNVAVTVASSQIKSYTVSCKPASYELNAGDKQMLPKSTLSLEMKNGVGAQQIPLTLSWRSSDDTIAMVNNDYVFAAKEGSCSLVALSNGVAVEVPLTVLHRHVPEVLPPVTPTCLTTGLSTGSRCRVCGEVLQPQQVLPVLSHDFETKVSPAKYKKDGRIVNTCRMCGLREVNEIPQIKSFKVTDKSYTYDGAKHKPKVRLIDAEGTVLRRNRDYTLTYPSGMKKVGTYEIEVCLIGNYKGYKTLTFKILPAGVKNLRAVPGKKSAALSWDAAPGATNYIVYYSEKERGGYRKLGSTQKTTASMIQLDSGKTYYFRVRSVTRRGSAQWNGPLCSPVAVTAK